MRFMMILPVAALAACGGGENKNKAAPVAGIAPGQYEVTAQVTRFDKADEGAPKINTPVGTRTVRNVCAGATLNADLFGDEGFSCQTSGQPYVRGGVVNVKVVCTRPDLSGTASADVSGRYDATSFDVTRSMATALTTDGDVRVESHLTARRTGDCQPGAAAPVATPSANGAAAK